MSWNFDEAVAYYRSQGAPSDQNALTGLLREIQQEHSGSIPPGVLATVADAYGIRESFLLAIIRRIPSLRLSEEHCLELCAGPNCGKHRPLAEEAEALQRERRFVLKFVPCMRLCGKGPNLRWDGKLYHKATTQLLRQLTADAPQK